MSRKSEPKRDDPKQSERFIETARKIEADESGEKFERAFKKVLRPQKHPHSTARKESS